jgi:hypothetical protein
MNLSAGIGNPLETGFGGRRSYQTAEGPRPSMCYVKYIAGCGLSLLKRKSWLDFQRPEDLRDR